jgi:hypothetical protein
VTIGVPRGSPAHEAQGNPGEPPRVTLEMWRLRGGVWKSAGGGSWILGGGPGYPEDRLHESIPGSPPPPPKDSLQYRIGAPGGHVGTLRLHLQVLGMLILEPTVLLRCRLGESSVQFPGAPGHRGRFHEGSQGGPGSSPGCLEESLGYPRGIPGYARGPLGCPGITLGYQ